jgi:hypothetical protein
MPKSSRPNRATPNGEQVPQLAAAKEGFSVVYRGKALLSLIAPARACEKVLSASLPAKGRTLYLCASPLFGYGLAGFAAALPEDSALLCVEADPALYQWTLEY